jgi:hypothetical protein
MNLSREEVIGRRLKRSLTRLVCFCFTFGCRAYFSAFLPGHVFSIGKGGLSDHVINDGNAFIDLAYRLGIPNESATVQYGRVRSLRSALSAVSTKVKSRLLSGEMQRGGASLVCVRGHMHDTNIWTSGFSRQRRTQSCSRPLMKTAHEREIDRAA